MTEKRYTLKLDYDEYGWPELLLASDLLDLVHLDAQRFLNYPQIGGVIVILRSWQGYHLKAPFACLTREEQKTLSRMSFADTGYKYWVQRHGKATLRIGEKVIVRQVKDQFVGKKTIHSRPQVIEIIKRGDELE